MLGIIAHLLQTSSFGASGVGVVSPLNSGADGTSALPEPDVSWGCWYGCVSFPFIFFSLKFLSKGLHGVTDAKSSWGEVEL